jgi:hypothetical protein
LGQRLYWGSDAWIDSYGRRGQIEAAFGNEKSTKTAGLKRGLFFVVGIVKNGIMLACVVAATNIRLMRMWSARTADRTNPLSAEDPDSHGFEELDAHGNPTSPRRLPLPPDDPHIGIPLKQPLRDPFGQRASGRCREWDGAAAQMSHVKPPTTGQHVPAPNHHETPRGSRSELPAGGFVSPKRLLS